MVFLLFNMVPISPYWHHVGLGHNVTPYHTVPKPAVTLSLIMPYPAYREDHCVQAYTVRPTVHTKNWQDSSAGTKLKNFSCKVQDQLV